MEGNSWDVADDISGSLLDVFRESGDGDSGAESKESESNGEDRDYHSIKMVLLDITREVPGAETNVEKPKEKKQSRIPIRQKKSTFISSNFDSSETSDMFIDIRDTDGSESELNQLDESTTGGSTEIDISRFVCDSTSSTGPGAPTTATEADGSQPESDKHSLDCEMSIRDGIAALSVHLKDIAIDLDDVNETIIEAPEEFRTEADATIVSETDVGEPGRPNKEPLIRDDDNGSKAEAGDTCRRAPYEDASEPSDNGPPETDSERSPCECECVGDPNRHDDPSDNNNAGVAHKCNGEVTYKHRHVGTCRQAAPALHAFAGDVQTGDGQSPPDSFIQAANEALVRGADLISKLQMLSGPVGERSVPLLERFVPVFDASVDCVREPAAAEPSIDAGVEVCARTSGCSRVSTATVCAALDNEGRSNPVSCDQDNNQDNQESRIKPPNCAKLECDTVKSASVVENKSAVSFERPLSWEFRNGRLVFDVAKENESDSGLEQEDSARENKGDDGSQSSNEEEVNSILHSRDINKRKTDTSSRLKYLEKKLKEAGITDKKTEESSGSKLSNNAKDVPPPSDNAKQTSASDKEEQVVDKSSLSSSDDDSTYYDANQTLPCENDEPEELNDKTNESNHTTSSSFCEFDVRQVASFAGFEADDYYVVYDELDETSSEEETEYHHLRVTKPSTMRGEDLERSKHNPDQDNLKSLLKKPGRSRDSKKSNRVVFNENKNEFFDADYIILIREECDYDEDDDDGVCCCNQHEMVRLACCEPNCNCGSYEGYADPTPQSPKFAPPLEFVDAVTLSPPEGYKDMELGEQQLFALQQLSRRGQRAAVCRECSASHDEDEEGSHSEDGGEQSSDQDDKIEKEKTDQSQQTTPTTPPPDADDSDVQKYILLKTVTMTSEQPTSREAPEDDRKTKSPSPSLPPGGSPISGILKGGRLWKQQSLEAGMAVRNSEALQNTDSATSDEETANKRSVRFTTEPNEDKRDGCDGAPDAAVSEEPRPAAPDATELTLTFKLGNHVLVSNNSLKPNSAVRQLFPSTGPAAGGGEAARQYLVTAESLRAFEEAKRARLPQVAQGAEADASIKRAIERNTLRRSLIRYEPKSKKITQKTDNSLVERIKQLTCDVDDINQEEIPARASPPGEEARNSPENHSATIKNHDKSFSPSSSSTTSSNSSSVSSTYKKITDLFGKRERTTPDIQNNVINEQNRPISQLGPAPDLGNGGNLPQHDLIDPHCPVTKANSNSEARKQFLSSLAPLTACVGGTGSTEDYYYHMNNTVGDRTSMASSVGTEYSLEDIDEGLKNEEEETKRIAPDVLAGTPSASESGDELAMFVQQDASRIERIKKKYQPDVNNEDDDEHDDYGFNRRPSVRGIKPRFGSTTEILQQIQNQLQPPPPAARANNQHAAWPYYSETGISAVDNTKPRNVNQNVYYHPAAEDAKSRNFAPQYRPTSLIEESTYQNCANQRCTREVAYRANVNHVNFYPPVVRVGGGCGDFYQSLTRNRNGRPQSPPPLEVSKNYHQTMVYIPYNHIEGYQPSAMSPTPYYPQNDVCYTRVSNQNQINKRYIDPIYASQNLDDHHYQPNVIPLPPKQLIRVTYSNQQTHLVNSRSESPLPGQYSTARATQTPGAATSCGYYPANPRFRPVVGPWQTESPYGTKPNPNRHSFPSGPRYPPPEELSDGHHLPMNLHNGYRQTLDLAYPTQKDSVPNSPTKPRFIERGVPEGAASVSPQNQASVAQSTSTMTSPTSPQNPQQTHQKPLFYAMNV